MKTKLAGTLVLIGVLFALPACGGGGSNDFCDAANSVESLTNNADIAPGDLEGLKSYMQQLTDGVQKADNSAPPEIKSDLDTASAALQKVNDSIQGANSVTDLQALKPQLQELQQTVSSLGDNVDNYVNDNC
jgi:hypothetical protein